MARTLKGLMPKQVAVLEDLFEPEVSDEEILKKYNVSPRTLKRWMREDAFREEVEYRIGCSKRYLAILMAKYGTVAATKLLNLTQCESGETARKACLDILNIPQIVEEKIAAEARAAEGAEVPEEVSSKIFALLAGARRKGD